MKICAIIVSYHPEPSILANVDSLKSQVPAVVVVDNGSGIGSQPILEQIESRPGIKVIRNQTNQGLGAALNLGVHYGLETGHDWIATFDQDSTVSRNYFNTMQTAYESCSRRDEVALISPVYRDSTWSHRDAADAGSVPLYSVISDAWTSGSLVKATAIEAVGGYDEMLFIDYVDFDFCLRLRRAGFKLIRSHRALLAHRLGTAEVHSFLGFDLTLKSHHPLRHYYMTRNRLIVCRRYAMSFPYWVLKESRWFLLNPLKVLLFEKDKWTKIGCLIKGFTHGLAYSCEPGVRLPRPAEFSEPATNRVS